MVNTQNYYEMSHNFHALVCYVQYTCANTSENFTLRLHCTFSSIDSFAEFFTENDAENLIFNYKIYVKFHQIS